jgi:hypothetical protein
MLRPRNIKLGMMIVHDQQITPLDFWVKGSKVKIRLNLLTLKLGRCFGLDQKMPPNDVGVKGQGHIDLVSKNSFRSITKKSLGLGTSNLV